MSRRWRQKHSKTLVAASPEEAGNAVAKSNTEDMFFTAAFPGPREIRFLDSQNYVSSHSGVGDIEDNVDWEVGGIPGMTKAVYSTGVVESTNVDAHDFDGAQAIIRRMPDTNFGDVGTADYNSQLAFLYAMSEADIYFPNETSQSDLILGV